ncbi:hypothetical protein I6E68_06760 [Salinibacterium sp. NSLL150]|uniref:hypothetical protein n=1 Tax=unclassified Salinibacterium TaxID=2632331 RepID=UPI0018CE403A|nr:MULTISPECIES: hypothetical protein [unclassified Salinibacterium]MBH0098836.1 hypothetical protein [Salinibacterium sp. NSLL35]MBH0101591.1 hypothetical protein [Salinibacterium sp. NSLL150]MBH0104350.1 hypothetical protein [Salinibacterium sp. NSLL16]MBH0107111.1 hypothetical protein [Salinibacterium sp. NSLL17]
MRQPNLLRLSIGALLLATLSGCVPSDASTAPAPTSTFVAPYATDEEALAAAEEAYAEYTRVIGEVLQDGGADASRLETVAAGTFLEASVKGLEEFAEKGGRATGSVLNSGFELQRYSPTGSTAEVITVYLCANFSNLALQDKDGNSLVAEDRPDESTMQVTFDFDAERQLLLVSDVQVWNAGEC